MGLRSSGLGDEVWKYGVEFLKRSVNSDVDARCLHVYVCCVEFGINADEMKEGR